MRAQPSTTVEVAPSGERDPNLHHNIGRSRTGSNEDNNLSTVGIGRHDGFHNDVASNAVPTELAKYVGLHSIGLPQREKRLDATQLRELLDATSAIDWKKYYWNDATVSASDINGSIRALQNLRITSHFLQQEMGWVRNSLSAIRLEGAAFPADEHPLLANAMKFFGAKTPAKAIDEFLDEKNNGEFSWTKPLRHQKREQIHGILSKREGLASDNRKEYVHVLLEQHKVLDTHQREIERTITKLYQELQKVMQMSVLRPDGDA